ncbi:MAG: ribose 5-phosphate isomerase B [Rhodospirillaceae bacterium]
MSSPVVAFASDHGGFELKCLLLAVLISEGWTVLDLGTDSAGAVDYPDIAERLVASILDKRAGVGVLLCGSGIGIGIAANRFHGIRAAICANATMARLARAHNDANVLALGARVMGYEVARDCLRTFLATPFDGGERHERRIAKLDILG